MAEAAETPSPTNRDGIHSFDEKHAGILPAVRKTSVRRASSDFQSEARSRLRKVSTIMRFTKKEDDLDSEDEDQMVGISLLEALFTRELQI